MTWRELQALLRGEVRRRVAAGEFTERGLASETGISQPHLHNVLKGRRDLTPAVGDLLLARLKLSLRDLLSAPSGHRLVEVPELDGLLAPDRPFPVRDHPLLRRPFASAAVAGFLNPRLVRLGPGGGAAPDFREDDVLMLDYAPGPRRAPAPGAWFAAAHGPGGAVRMARLRGGRLDLFSAPGVQQECISLGNRHILDVLRARIVWLGRQMESSEAPAGPAEEAGLPTRSADREG